MTIDRTINNISERLKPVKPMRHPVVRVVPWMAACALYVVFVVQFIGVRPDIGAKMGDAYFLLEITMGALVFISAGLCTAFLSVPDERGQGWIMIVPLILTAVIVLWSLIRSISEGLALPALHWDHCFADAVFLGTVPAAFMMFMTTQGFTTRPRLMALMHVLSVAGLGYVALRFTCMMDTVGHSFIYHLIPFVVFGAVMGVLSRRIFRW